MIITYKGNTVEILPEQTEDYYDLWLLIGTERGDTLFDDHPGLEDYLLQQVEDAQIRRNDVQQQQDDAELNEIWEALSGKVQ